jgi:hypothetical protein
MAESAPPVILPDGAGYWGAPLAPDSWGFSDFSHLRYGPAARGYERTINGDPKQQELPAPSELNYDVARWVIARPRYRGLNFMAGFSELGMVQSYHGAWLPPPVRVGPIQRARNVGGAWGMGSISASTIHIPGVLVPPTVG